MGRNGPRPGRSGRVRARSVNTQPRHGGVVCRSWRRVQEADLQGIAPGSFQDYCHTIRRTLQSFFILSFLGGLYKAREGAYYEKRIVGVLSLSIAEGIRGVRRLE